MRSTKTKEAVNVSSALIGAERRRKICSLVEQWGSVNVSDLARMLNVAPTTVRQDLDRLDKEGKLQRSHGGAVSKESRVTRLPYAQTRDTHQEQKEWIGEAALEHIPESGLIFIAPGTTALEFARRIPEGLPLRVVTCCPRIALHLIDGPVKNVHLLGGPMRLDSYATNCVFDPMLDTLHWDVAFVGVPAVSVTRGMCTVDMEAAILDRKVIEHTSKLVVLCDSSKFSLGSYATIGPVSLIDVIITDDGVSSETVDQLTAQGVEVVIAGPHTTHRP